MRFLGSSHRGVDGAGEVLGKRADQAHILREGEPRSGGTEGAPVLGWNRVKDL